MRCTGPAYGCPWSALQPPPQRCLRVRPAEEAGPTLPYVSAPVLSRRARIAGYVALTKPRIIELLLITTVPTMIVAERGLPSLWLMICTVLGGTMAAGGANAVNMYVDRDIDKIMERTQKRPLEIGRAHV